MNTKHRTIQTTSTGSPAPANSTTADAGKLLLRVSVGMLVLLHGLFKITHGVGFVSAMFERAGLPGTLGYLSYIGEVVAPLMMVLGVGTRAGAAVVSVTMLVALGLVHMGQLFALTPQGGWALELQGLFLFGAMAVALLGAGRYSVMKPSRFN